MTRRDILYFNTWYRGHNNARYEELLPRLDRVRPYLLTFPRSRVARAGAERLWRVARGNAEPVTLAALQRRHPYAFVTDLRQLPSLHVPAFVDVDDLDFTPENAALLARSTAVAYAVTAESAARKLEALGVGLPWHVIPQGAALDAGPAMLAPPAADGPVVGYVAAFLVLPGDRGGENPLYDMTHTLELWEEIRAAVPSAELWLVGAPGPRLRARVAGRRDIRLFGRRGRAELLSILSGVDVAIYPRRSDPGIRASKVAEYLGAGLPVVAYDLPVVDDLRAAGSGLLVASPAGFVGAVVRLLGDDAKRGRLAAAAAAEGARRDWRVLAADYAALLDRYLPRLD